MELQLDTTQWNLISEAYESWTLNRWTDEEDDEVYDLIAEGLKNGTVKLSFVLANRFLDMLKRARDVSRRSDFNYLINTLVNMMNEDRAAAAELGIAAEKRNAAEAALEESLFVVVSTYYGDADTHIVKAKTCAHIMRHLLGNQRLEDLVDVYGNGEVDSYGFTVEALKNNTVGEIIDLISDNEVTKLFAFLFTGGDGYQNECSVKYWHTITITPLDLNDAVSLDDLSL